jgi:hypothetical protein
MDAKIRRCQRGREKSGVKSPSRRVEKQSHGVKPCHEVLGRKAAFIQVGHFPKR